MGYGNFSAKARAQLEKLDQYCAHNYASLKVIIEKASGSWCWDLDGKKYFDMTSGYSAINFGHSNPRFVAAAKKQLDQVTMVSRAFMHDQLAPFCEELAAFAKMEMVLPMNSGAEAIETAIKCARRWGYEKKKVEENKAEIITFSNNFAGRTTTIISFSDNESYKENFGPFTPGFKILPFGDIEAVKKAVTKNTVAIFLEPIQGEGGILIPPDGFLKAIRDLCDSEKIVMVADEAQSGFCRAGYNFACEYENVLPDLYTVGKSLGGGIMPISAVIGKREFLEVFTPGSHGSTFGGNSFGCAIAREVLKFINEENMSVRSLELGAVLQTALKSIKSPHIEAVRGRGLMIGIDIRESSGKGKKFCEKFAEVGVLCKDTRDQTIRFTPPITSSKEDILWAVEQVRTVLEK